MRCDECQQDKPDVNIVVDPFSELGDEEWLRPLCGDCHQNRADDF